MHRVRSDFLRLTLAAGILLWGSIVVTPASAATITYNFTGDVAKVQNLLSPPFVVDLSPSPAAMHGSMTVDTFDNNALSTRFGEYKITNFTVTVEGQTYTQGPTPFFGVEIQNGLPGQDEFNVTVTAPNGPNIPGPDFFVPSIFDVKLHAPGPTGPFSTDALPTTVPSIASFTTKNEWRLEFGPGGKAVSGSIIEMTAVPLPTAMVLFGAGLVALIGLGAGNSRKQNSSLA